MENWLFVSDEKNFGQILNNSIKIVSNSIKTGFASEPGYD